MTQSDGTNRNGIMFSFDPVSSTYKKLKDFDNNSGGNPQGSLLKVENGKLFGTTINGGSNGQGVLFSYDISLNAFQKLKDFNAAEGANPASNLTQGINGKLYGSTGAGGLYSVGLVYSFDISTTAYNKLHHFGHPNGIFAFASVTKADDGKLYGVTRQGGAANWGVIYS